MTDTCERCIFYHAFPAKTEADSPNIGSCVTDPPQPVYVDGRVEWLHPVVHRSTFACRHYSFKPL